MKRLCLVLTIFFISNLQTDVKAQVVFNTPATQDTVQQNQSLFWNILSDQTSLSPFGAIGDFELSDHGDFHFEPTEASMVTLPFLAGGDLFDVGVSIGPDSNFDSGQFAGTTDFDGEMNVGDRGYFGLSFLLEGQTHYGWVEITEALDTQTIHGWAYEATPNATITTGATGVPEPNSSILIFCTGLTLGLGRTRRN